MATGWCPHALFHERFLFAPSIPRVYLDSTSTQPNWSTRVPGPAVFQFLLSQLLLSALSLEMLFHSLVVHTSVISTSARISGSASRDRLEAGLPRRENCGGVILSDRLPHYPPLSAIFFSTQDFGRTQGRDAYCFVHFFQGQVEQPLSIDSREVGINSPDHL